MIQITMLQYLALKYLEVFPDTQELCPDVWQYGMVAYLANKNRINLMEK